VRAERDDQVRARRELERQRRAEVRSRCELERDDEGRARRELERERRAEDEYFARMWSEDAEAKARKEEAERRRQAEASEQTAAVLQQQIADVDEKRRHEKQLLDEQAQILVSATASATILY